MASWTTSPTPVKMFFSLPLREISEFIQLFPPQTQGAMVQTEIEGFMECVIGYQRPISTQVLFYVLPPDGHKRAPMQDDVYFMFGRKLFFFLPYV